MTLTIPLLRCLLPCALLSLAACAPIAVQPPEYAAGRAHVYLPSGAWEDLGTSDQVLALLPDPGDSVALQTRALGLRGARNEWLAVVWVQTNRTDQLRRPVLWPNPCAPQRDVIVEDAAQGSPVRADCLRFKRWGSSSGWLEKNQPELAQWLDRRKISLVQPYSYLNYHYASEGGAFVVVQALVDQRLLRPRVGNNEEFLASGRPALQWGRELAQAARMSTGMMDGYLPVPPFPYPVPAQ